MIHHRALDWEQRKLRGTEKSCFAIDEVPSRRAIPPLTHSRISQLRQFFFPTGEPAENRGGPAVPQKELQKAASVRFNEGSLQSRKRFAFFKLQAARANSQKRSFLEHSLLK